MTIKKVPIFKLDLLTNNNNNSSSDPDSPGYSSGSDKPNPFLGKPFYCWDTHKFGRDNCCFNHMVGLPKKYDKECPLYEWQKELLSAIDIFSKIWLKKARGIGATTLVWRYLCWLCLRDNRLNGKSIFLISGTREHGADRLLEENVVSLFKPYPEYDHLYSRKYTEMYISKTWLKAFPTRSVKDMRGSKDVVFVFVDEADHFKKSEYQELPFVINSFEEKSKAKIIMVSTPDKPDGLYATIEKQSEAECVFKRIFWLYKTGLGTIFDPVWIAQQKVKDPVVFEREYNGKYLGGVGNVFTDQQVNICLELGDQFATYPEYEMSIYHYGVDPGFGSSKTGVVGWQWIPEYRCAKCIYVREYERANPNHVVNDLANIHSEKPNSYFWVDLSNSGFLTELKTKFGEDLDWFKEKEEYWHPDNMRILPVSFSTTHKALLSHFYQKVNRPMVAIPRGKQNEEPGKEFNKLEISLRSCYAKEYSLDKDETSYDDVFDGARLGMWGYRTT